jgi:hypothetical protein
MNKQITTNIPEPIMKMFRVKCAEQDTNPTAKLRQLATQWTLRETEKTAKKVAKWASSGNAIGEAKQ